MATVINEHVVPDPEGMIPERFRTFKYGPLETFPSLWFVQFKTRADDYGSTTHTFAVSSGYAQSTVFETTGPDVGWWTNISKAHWEGDWCQKLELLWKDIPYQVFTFKDGKQVRIGMSHTAIPQQDGKYFWYVVFCYDPNNVANPSCNDDVYIVEPACCQPEYMNKLGSDPHDWMLICSGHPAGLGDPRTSQSDLDEYPRGINWVFERRERDRQYRRKNWHWFLLERMINLFRGEKK